MVQSFITFLIIFLLIGVVIVLLAGVISMAVGGRFSPEFRNKLMRIRVGIQGLILLLVAVTFLISLFQLNF